MNNSVRDDELFDEALDRSGVAKGSGSYVMCAVTRTEPLD